MSALVVTVDLGNTRCKLRAWRMGEARAGELSASVDFATDGALIEATRRWADAWTRAAAARSRDVSCFVSSVGATELERELARVLAETLGVVIRVNPPAGIAIHVDAPERVGRDRLFAARGALELVSTSAIVVDAGTALTVDAVRAVAGTAEFLGGAIAPGPRLLALALRRHTSRLPLVEPKPGAAALGRDTEAALQAGIVVGFRGAARELAARVAHESGLGAAPIVVTGGARRFLLEPDACFDARVVADENLVHRGLLAAALDPGFS